MTNIEFNLDTETQLVTVDDPTPTVSVLWDQAVQLAVIETRVGPTVASRAYGIVHTAIYDAWSAYEGTPISTTSGDDLQRPESENTVENKTEAMSFAAYKVLVELFPEQQEIFAEVMSELGFDPSEISTDPTTPAGIGNIAAEALLDFRSQDGSNQNGDDPNGNGTPYSDTTGYQPVNEPGNIEFIDLWTPDLVPTDGSVDPRAQNFLTPQWGSVTPFGLDSGDQFRPVAPQPFLLVEGEVDLEAKTVTLEDGSVVDISPEIVGTIINPEFIAQAEQVVEISANLTDEEKLVAEFWEDGGGTSFPPGTWMTFGQAVSARDDNTLDEDAQLFFSLGNAVFDAGVATWEAKLFYNYARPVSVVRELGELGLIGEFNEELGGFAIEAYAGPGNGTQTILASDFITYQTPGSDFSPPFAEYTSGHSAFSAAGAEILQQFTGSDDFGASITFEPGESRFEPGITPEETVTLEWDTFSEASDEAGISRLYGGIHFTEGDLNGRALGREVGDAVFDQTEFFINGGDINTDEDVILGTDASDILLGTENDDQIEGLAGLDVINGRDGDDFIDGGDGVDLILGNEGDDTILGGAGNDKFFGNQGDDVLDGNEGIDVIFTGEGEDQIVLRIGDGTDFIFDYSDGEDKFLLVDGLTYEELEISSHVKGTEISVAETNESLAVVTIFDEDLLDQSDFITEAEA